LNLLERFAILNPGYLIAITRFALMHGVNHSQISKSGVSHFFEHERVRNNADDLAACGKNCIGQPTHESDFAASVNQR
jgi:hypothetical protein